MDDEDVVRDMVSAMLATMGYDTACVANAKEAIESFNLNRETLVALILDLTIPGGPGGKETLQAIRKLDKEIPAFVASGYAEDPVMANPVEYGFNGSICKPFRKAELATLLNAHLATHKQ